MDSAWAFRQAYDEGRKIKNAQDVYCAKVEAGAWDDLGELPESLQWESIVDVLRGKVKVRRLWFAKIASLYIANASSSQLSIHCYEVHSIIDVVAAAVLMSSRLWILI